MIEYEHVQRFLSRLPIQFKKDDGSYWRKLAEAIGAEANRVEETLQDILTQRSIATAEGEQLNVIGRIVKQEREGSSDADYRIRIRAKVLVNRSSGTINEIIDIFELLATDSTLTGAVVHVTESPPAQMQLRFSGVTLDDDQVRRLTNLLRQAKAAGVRFDFVYLTYPPEETFTFDGVDGQGWDEGHWATAVVV